MADAIATFDQTSFAEELATADKPILVDFWAEWCGPCRALEPILKEVASENGDKITVAKVNVDENPDIARQFDIMSIPTLIVFKDGKRLGQGRAAPAARRVPLTHPRCAGSPQSAPPPPLRVADGRSTAYDQAEVVGPPPHGDLRSEVGSSDPASFRVPGPRRLVAAVGVTGRR